MQKEPDLVGAGSRTGGPIGGQVKLMGLQQVLHAAPLAVFPLVEPLRPAVGQVGDDVAGVDPVGSTRAMIRRWHFQDLAPPWKSV